MPDKVIGTPGVAKRKKPGTDVYIVGSSSTDVLGKIRLVTARGGEITDNPSKSIRTKLVAGNEVIGKVMIVDSEGKELGTLLRAFLEQNVR